MPKPKVFVTRRMARKALDLISDNTDMTLWEDDQPPPYDVLREEARKSDGLVTLLEDQINEDLFKDSPNLKVVSQMAVGFDNIDVDNATKRGIPVGHTPGVLSKTVADCTFALLLASARRIVEADKFVRKGKWKSWHPMAFLGKDVFEGTLGLIGLGGVGLEVAKRAKGFDMEVFYYDIFRREDKEKELGIIFNDIPTILKKSDFISLHTPLTPDTYHLISDKELAMMKPDAILINTARGPVIDQKALYHALKSQSIGVAALDVADPEPMEEDDPLLELDNLIILPHIASASIVTRTKMAMMAADNLLAGLRGDIPPNCVNAKELQI